MPRVDRARRARTGTPRIESNAPPTGEGGAPPTTTRFAIASAARVRAPRHRLGHHRAHARWLGELVLVVTDDAALRRSLGNALAAQGYRAVAGGSPGRIDEQILRIQPILILFDLDRRTERANGDSLSALVRLRDAARDTPVIALSARGGEGDKVTALDVGADDYLTKPFGMSELLARMRVALRRARARATGEVVEVGPIRIDHVRHQVTVNGELVHLTPIEFRILALLVKHAGEVLSHDQLLHDIWGPGADEAHNLRVHIAALRQKIEQDPARPRWLVTVMKMGYRLCDE